jgi:hypothetical protein
VVVVDAPQPDAAIDAPLWLPGERPLPRSAGNENPPMCMQASACAAACDSGDGASCYWLGVMYVTKSDVPMDVPHDPQKGLEKFLEACDHGITLGCNGAAQLFRLGSLGIPFDEARSRRLFEKACGLGMDAACRNAKQMKVTPAR